jgi:hypothetical protein
MSKVYHPFLNNVKFLGGLKRRKRVEGEHKSIFFTPTLSLPRQKGEGKEGEYWIPACAGMTASLSLWGSLREGEGGEIQAEVV